MATTKDEKPLANGLEVICNLETDGSYEFLYRLGSKLLEEDGKTLRKFVLAFHPRLIPPQSSTINRQTTPPTF
jgi:hypothetical protein